MKVKLRSDDRVLLLGIPAAEEVARLARVLMQGVLIGLGSAEEVDQARRAFAEFENTMFLNASLDQIPWRDAFFTKIVVPPHWEPVLRNAASEVNRVLAPGGEIIRETLDA